MSQDVLQAGTSVAPPGRGGEPARPRAAWPERLAPWVLMALVAAVFARTVSFGLTLDDAVILRHWPLDQVLRSFHDEFDQLGFNDPYFRPLVPVVFGLEWHVWGTRVWGYHLVNIALHAGATLTVYALTRRLLGRWWAAFGAAALFAVLPSSAAEVAYVAQRCDVMAALFIVGGLAAVRRYHERRRPRDLAVLAAMFVGAVLSKEIGIAITPMALSYWWYLRVEARHPARLGRTGGESTLGAWTGEIRAWLTTLVARDERRSWLTLGGVLAVLSAVYLGYRSWALGSQELGNRFGETANPVSALASGIRWTLSGVPWEVRSRTILLVPLVVLTAFALNPRSRHWRVVILGGLLVVAGVLPLTFTGGVEPRLLYVAQLGTAVLAAGLLGVIGTGLAADRGGAPAVRQVARAGVAGLAAVYLALTLVAQIDAQNQYRPGSAKRTNGDLELWQRLTPEQVEQMPRVYVEELEARLRERGQIPAGTTKLDG